MNRERARAHIRFLAEADRIVFLHHALTRSPKDGKFALTREQIKQCLIQGSITEGPAPDIKETNGWKFTMRRFRGGEKNEVAGVLIPEKKVIVITGYGWERLMRGQTASVSEGEDMDDDGVS